MFFESCFLHYIKSYHLKLFFKINITFKRLFLLNINSIIFYIIVESSLFQGQGGNLLVSMSEIYT